MGGGLFFTENRPQTHKKHAILHTSQANGGARAPPVPPLATLLIAGPDIHRARPLALWRFSQRLSAKYTVDEDQKNLTISDRGP